ncbi:outer membrane beta-barrel protein [Dyadobacter sp. 32]|uniref:outer membrane beta-barrel protein n=1 Tax=Dyadobacter sp. 32 TaxID=538966 RepID=UPI0011EDBA5A
MNKSFSLLLFLFILNGFVLKAQDLIVSIEGDSLNCTVMTQNLKYVSFFYKDGGELVTRELPRNLFKSVIVGFYKSAAKQAAEPVSKGGISILREENKANAIDQVNPAQPAESVLAIPEKFGEIVSATNVEAEAKPEKPDSVNVGSEGSSQPIKRVVNQDSVSIQPKWQFGFRGGYANRLFKTGNKFSPGVTKYLKELKSGYSIGASAGYFFWENVNLGLVTDLYGSAATMQDDSRNDAVRIKYIGPQVSHRRVLSSGNGAVYTGFSVGYQGFSNKGQEAGKNFSLTGRSMGWGANVGFDYKISPRASLSLGAACLFGTLYKMTDINKETIKLTKDNFEDLSRIALTVGLRFY